jgi:hypothetical protein
MEPNVAGTTGNLHSRKRETYPIGAQSLNHFRVRECQRTVVGDVQKQKETPFPSVSNQCDTNSAAKWRLALTSQHLQPRRSEVLDSGPKCIESASKCAINSTVSGRIAGISAGAGLA